MSASAAVGRVSRRTPGWAALGALAFYLVAVLLPAHVMGRLVEGRFDYTGDLEPHVPQVYEVLLRLGCLAASVCAAWGTAPFPVRWRQARRAGARRIWSAAYMLWLLSSLVLWMGSAEPFSARAMCLCAAPAAVVLLAFATLHASCHTFGRGAAP